MVWNTLWRSAQDVKNWLTNQMILGAAEISLVKLVTVLGVLAN